MRYLCLVLVVFSSLSLASSNTLELKNFSFGMARVTPSDWQTSVFPEVAWTPHLDFGSVLVRLGLGISSPKDSNESHFMTTYYQAGLILPVVSLFSVEAFGGMRTFHTRDIGTHPEFGGSFILRTAEFLDRFYISMSQYLIPENPTSILRIGMALSF
jgi:hypothetical protein